MILQALNAYYQRLADDPSENVPRQGYSREKIHFALVIGQDGTLLDVHDLRERAGKRTVPKELLVPSLGKPRSGTKAPPNFLWDNTGYVLGADAKGKPEHARSCCLAFRELVRKVPADGDTGIAAVLAFLDNWNPDDASQAVSAFLPWDEVAGWNVVFRLDGDMGYIHDRPAARTAWEALRGQSADAEQGFCLITGRLASIARLHPTIKGVHGAQSSGAALVSFNLDASTSYGKKQNHNAPVSEAAAFGYTTALNHLLRESNNRRVQIGDATTVFWSERPSVLEDLLGLFLGKSPPPAAPADNTDAAGVAEGQTNDDADGRTADDGGLARHIHRILKAVCKGQMPPELGDTNVPFYVLGLASSMARLSVRFFEVSSTGEIVARMGNHFRHIAIETRPLSLQKHAFHSRNSRHTRRFEQDLEFPSVAQLLTELAPTRKNDSIPPPTLTGALMRAILGGHPYPRSLLATIIERIRADHEVSYLRAALLKGYFTRAPKGDNTWEVGVTLDPASTDIGYRLGRLFAVLEKAQRDALPGINATIKDRFYGSVSSTPRVAFPRLIHLAQAHLGKLDRPKRIFIDKLLLEIADEIDNFPAHLTMDEQGRFALGYYHQCNALWRSSDTTAQAPVPADD
uniref:CRISPR-associated protein, Csd1 family n=1 Tax=Nitratidesulfovibrio vulgaris (strain DSM 19637 / Miyazaki F) TaxID=883 RepID=B8DQ52_NITV9